MASRVNQYHVNMNPCDYPFPPPNLLLLDCLQLYYIYRPDCNIGTHPLDVYRLQVTTAIWKLLFKHFYSYVPSTGKNHAIFR